MNTSTKKAGANKTILAIETSCDESSIAILDVEGELPNPTFTVYAHNTASQIAMHVEYGGVFPSVAKREHAKALAPLLHTSLEQSNLLQTSTESQISDAQKTKLSELLHREPVLYEQMIELFEYTERPNVDTICVTHGPGLAPSLWVGINFAKALSIIWDMPIMPVNHMKGHIWSVFANDTTFTLPDVSFPILTLLISGGHTELVLVHDWDSYEKIGQTRDDAVGEAFDKVGRMLGLPYPAGPVIDKLAQDSRLRGNDSGGSEISEKDMKENESKSNTTLSSSGSDPRIQLPRPMIHSNDLDFSFSGLKTAVRNLLSDLTTNHSRILENTRMVTVIATEFQNAVTDVLVHKTRNAIEQHAPTTLIISGGVSANSQIRSAMQELASEHGITCLTPPLELTGDNALMIGVAGAIDILNNKKSPNLGKIQAFGNLRL